MVLKSDGSGLYATKDLALAKRKFDEFHIDQSIYVVDAAQTLHFKQVNHSIHACARRAVIAHAARSGAALPRLIPVLFLFCLCVCICECRCSRPLS